VDGSQGYPLTPALSPKGEREKWEPGREIERQPGGEAHALSLVPLPSVERDTLFLFPLSPLGERAGVRGKSVDARIAFLMTKQ